VGSAARTWPGLLSTVIGGASLAAEDTAWAMREIMRGDATSAQVAGFVVALRAKGETVEEVTGFASTMLEFATPVRVPGPTLDIVGTGGDRAHTVNLSSMAAVVVAAAGVPVVKHGNRAASSACGSADLLEQLGVAIDLGAAQVAAVAAEAGITFCFAPHFHGSMRHAAGPRSELGIPTIFNFLGPLTNPARPAAQAVGCADPRMAAVMAGVYAGRGVSALVFRGDDGLDELTTTTTSQVWVVPAGGGAVEWTSFDPRRLDIGVASAESLRGGDARHNAEVARRFLAGHRDAVRDAVLLNAAAGLVAAEGATAAGLESDMARAWQRAAAAVDNGAAESLLSRWVQASQRHRSGG
jgi:anthranilate phosphoribosyltransferase